MKETLSWQNREVVNIYDEVNLWSAPFGRLLLDNIPMKPGSAVLDIGFGTGFPLTELSQRFGERSKIYGIDIWNEAVKRTREKIRMLGLTNIEIFEQSAEQIPLPDNELDLICSNLGINNFENKKAVLNECHRVINKSGSLCITTNTDGTFRELFALFSDAMTEMKLEGAIPLLKDHIDHRGTEESIISDFRECKFSILNTVRDETHIRFADPESVLDHGLIRIGFLDNWKELIPPDQQKAFFELVELKINQEIETKGEFAISVPVLFLEFKKI